MKPTFAVTDPSKGFLVIRESQRLVFGSLQQRPDQHRHIGPFWNSTQLAYKDWCNVGLETGLYPLLFDPVFCQEYDIKPLLQFSNCLVPLKDNHLNLAVEALNNRPSEISYPARAVNQWVIFWIEYCIKELDQPAVFCT